MQRHRGDDDDIEKDLSIAITATKKAVDYIINKKYFSGNNKSNSIVFVSSIADKYIAPEQSLGYHLGKAGFAQLTRYYAMELGQMNVRVNAVSPCVVLKKEAKGFYNDNQWLVDRFKEYIPLGRMGCAEDIVDAIIFLSSEKSSYITGQNIVVDGGLTLRSHESILRDFPVQ